ncbi:hypothetical protein [Actinomadura flavalba]|uniref:hypothetical protein n=1 Tax=Actinomadura flavalba TaxID=1120938 RepID=UPI0012DBDA84|nr:hypothetical protein [Actinomadura flavalba]
MSNNAAHEMSAAPGRMAGRFAGGMDEPGVAVRQTATHHLDPAITGLVSWLPPSGGTLSRAAIDRWTDAARSVLLLAYAREDEGKHER